MKLKGKVMLFCVTVVPCLPLLCMAILLLQKQAPEYHAEVREHHRGNWETLPNKVSHNMHKVLEPGAPQFPHTSSAGSSSAAAASDIDLQTLLLSETQDIDKRGRFQQDRISKMCQNHFFSREQRLPHNNDLPLFFRHLMFDDKRKAIFCFVPKIGCTDMKRLMLYMGGILPIDTIDWPWVEDSIYLEPALAKTSFLNKTLLLSEKVIRLKTYYKFMIVRNPLERLVSGYRNKLEGPVSYSDQDKFPNNLRVQILEQYRDSELRHWRMENGKSGSSTLTISVTFAEFVRHFIETDVMKLNDHFRPSIDICHPCIARYNFYANFRNFSSDVAQLIKKFQTEPRFYRNKSLHSSSKQTSNMLMNYYNMLTHRDKVQLMGKLYDDLLFYYTLYPADSHSHYQLLGIKHPII